MQTIGGEMFGCNRGAQEVAVFKQESLILGKAVFIAVINQGKSGFIAQALCELFAGLR